MAGALRTVDDEVEERFEEIKSDPTTVNVRFPGYAISRNPLMSEWIGNCNGIAVLGRDIGALSHHHSEHTSPYVYVLRMLEDLRREDGADGLVAVPIGGDSNHFTSILQILRWNGVEVIGQYLDRWMNHEEIIFGSDHKTKGHKTLIATPRTREVIMYSDPVGYRRLA